MFQCNLFLLHFDSGTSLPSCTESDELGNHHLMTSSKTPLQKSPVKQTPHNMNNNGEHRPWALQLAHLQLTKLCKVPTLHGGLWFQETWLHGPGWSFQSSFIFYASRYWLDVNKASYENSDKQFSFLYSCSYSPCCIVIDPKQMHDQNCKAHNQIFSPAFFFLSSCCLLFSKVPYIVILLASTKKQGFN